MLSAIGLIKKNLLTVSLICGASILFFACDSKKELKSTTTDTEVAEAFIRSTMDDNVSEAKKYIIKDEKNVQLLDDYERWFSKQDKSRKEAFKKAEIIVDKIEEEVKDSVKIFHYSNSFEPKNKEKLRLVRINGQWLIDFKYTFPETKSE